MAAELVETAMDAQLDVARVYLQGEAVVHAFL